MTNLELDEQLAECEVILDKARTIYEDIWTRYFESNGESLREEFFKRDTNGLAFKLIYEYKTISTFIGITGDYLFELEKQIKKLSDETFKNAKDKLEIIEKVS